MVTIILNENANNQCLDKNGYLFISSSEISININFDRMYKDSFIFYAISKVRDFIRNRNLENF